MKRKFLVLYDYGQGGAWAYLLADSVDEIRRRFPALRVFDEPPDWMRAQDLKALDDSMIIDVADLKHPFLAALPKS